MVRHVVTTSVVYRTVRRWVVTTEVVDGATCSNDFSRLPGGSATGSAAGSATCSDDFSRLPGGQDVGRKD